MRGRIDAVEDDGDMREEFRDNVESTFKTRRVRQLERRHRGGGQDLPHTVQRINSIVASFSLTRFKLMAIADCPIMIVPIWWPTLTGEILGR